MNYLYLPLTFLCTSLSSTMTLYLHNKNKIFKRFLKNNRIAKCSRSVFALYYENAIKLKLTYFFHIKLHLNRLKAQW